jgi:hypothetical protein
MTSRQGHVRIRVLFVLGGGGIDFKMRRSSWYRRESLLCPFVELHGSDLRMKS